MMSRGGTYDVQFGFSMSPVVIKLIIANLAAFVVQILLQLVHLDHWFMLIPQYAIRGCVWQVVTYMFMHGDVWHLTFNMLGLIFFGPPLEELWGGRRFLRFYLLTGALAGVCITLFHLVFGPDKVSVLGASACIYGILTAYAFYWPMRPIYLFLIIPVPAFLVVALYVLGSVASLGSMDGVSHIGHFSGFAVALGYLLIIEKTDFSATITRRFSQWKKKMKRPNITLLPDPPKKQINLEQEKRRMDDLLEKVAREGISSLTKEEREFLDSISRKI